jgi:Flp pilus assembly protein TadG
VPRKLAGFLRRLRAAKRGVAYIEFAYSMPVIMGMGLYGIEGANLAMTHMRMSQVALGVADNASRIGQDTMLATLQFREVDVLDTFFAAGYQAGTMDIAKRGRIILSSLENNAQGRPYIHWQRCMGELSYASTYGKRGDVMVDGMGPSGSKVKPAPLNAVMFVELAYDYEPIVSDKLLGKPRLKYTASFVVRDRRDLTGDTTRTGELGNIYNPDPKVPNNKLALCT